MGLCMTLGLPCPFWASRLLLVFQRKRFEACHFAHCTSIVECADVCLGAVYALDYVIVWKCSVPSTRAKRGDVLVLPKIFVERL